MEKPEAWISQTCDPIECYDPIVFSNVDTTLGLNAPVEIGPGETKKIFIYIMPNEMEGMGLFALDFSLASQPDKVIATANFEVEIQNLVVNTREYLKNQNFRIYPNPSFEYFRLTNDADVDNIVIHNLVHNKVKEFKTYPGAIYDVNQLPDGIYLVSLMNNEFGLIKTMRLVKSHLRP